MLLGWTSARTPSNSYTFPRAVKKRVLGAAGAAGCSRAEAPPTRVLQLVPLAQLAVVAVEHLADSEVGRNTRCFGFVEDLGKVGSGKRMRS